MSIGILWSSQCGTLPHIMNVTMEEKKKQTFLIFMLYIPVKRGNKKITEKYRKTNKSYFYITYEYYE